MIFTRNPHFIIYALNSLLRECHMAQVGISKTFMSLLFCELLNLHFSTNYTSFNMWVRYSVWNFKGYLWNSTQNILPIHWKTWFLYNVKNLRAPRFMSSYAFFKCPQVSLSHILLCCLIGIKTFYMILIFILQIAFHCDKLVSFMFFLICITRLLM